MRTSEVAKICEYTPQYVRALAREASNDGESFIKIDNDTFSFYYKPSSVGRGGKELVWQKEEKTKKIKEPIKNKLFNLLSLEDEFRPTINDKLLIVNQFKNLQKKGKKSQTIIEILNANYPLAKITKDKIYNWKKKLEKGQNLEDKRGKNKKVKLPEPWMEDFVLDSYRSMAQDSNYMKIYRDLHKEAMHNRGYNYYKFLTCEVEELVSYGKIKRFINRYYAKNELEFYTLLHGADKTDSYFGKAHGDAREFAEYKNFMWQIDSSPLDIILLDEEGNQVRYDLIQVIDVFSGRRVVDVTCRSNALSIIRLFWKALDTLGIPDVVVGDNGKDYVSDQFKDMLASLNIAYSNTMAFAGREKGQVERAFRTLQEGSFKGLPGWIGNSVAIRQLIEQQLPRSERRTSKVKTNLKGLMNIEQFKKVLDGVVIEWDISKLSGRVSPLELWNKCDMPIVKMGYQDYIKVAGARTMRTIRKKGIQHKNRFYVSEFLASLATKEKVEIRENIDNAGELFVFKEGELLGSVWDTTIKKVSAEEAKEHRKIFEKEAKKVRQMLESKKMNFTKSTKIHIENDTKKAKEAHERLLNKNKDEFVMFKPKGLTNKSVNEEDNISWEEAIIKNSS